MFFSRLPRKYSKHLDRLRILLWVETVTFTVLSIISVIIYNEWYIPLCLLVILVLTLCVQIERKRYLLDTVLLTESSILMYDYKGNEKVNVPYAKINKMELRTLKFWITNAGSVGLYQNELFICIYMDGISYEIQDGIDMYRDLYKWNNLLIFSYSKEAWDYLQAKTE